MQPIISSSTVGRLKPSWHYQTNGYVTGIPLITSNTVYAYDWAGYVYALDIKTGDLIYKKQLYQPATANSFLTKVPFLNKYLSEPLPYMWYGFAGSGYLNNNRLYLASVGSKPGKPLKNGAAGEFFVINAEDGKILSREKLSLPLYSGNLTALLGEGELVYVGISSCDEIVEVISKLLFKPYHPTSIGQVIAFDQTSFKRVWSKKMIGLLPDDALNAKGASIWGGFAVDPTSNTLVFGTGNNYGLPASKSSDSAIALNAITGDYKWQYQVTANDTWLPLKREGPDFDFGSTPVIFNCKNNNQTIKSVGLGNKNGYFYTFNLQTGELLWHTNCHINSESDDGIRSAASYKEGRLYIWTRNKKPKDTMTICSLNANTGEIIWSVISQGTNAMSNGLLLNDLYFVPTYDGKIYAYSLKDGHIVWIGEIPKISIGSSLSYTKDSLIFGAGVPGLYGGNPKFHGVYTFSLN